MHPRQPFIDQFRWRDFGDLVVAFGQHPERGEGIGVQGLPGCDAFQPVRAVLVAHRNPQFPQHPVGSDPGNADQLGQEQGRFTSLVRRKPVEENQNNLTISSVVVTSGAFINVAGLQQLQAKPSDHLRLIRVRRQRFSSEKRCWHSQKFVHSACTNALQVICSEFGFFYLVVNL